MQNEARHRKFYRALNYLGGSGAWAVTESEGAAFLRGG